MVEDKAVRARVLRDWACFAPGGVNAKSTRAYRRLMK